MEKGGRTRRPKSNPVQLLPFGSDWINERSARRASRALYDESYLHLQEAMSVIRL